MDFIYSVEYHNTNTTAMFSKRKKRLNIKRNYYEISLEEA